MSSTLSSVGRTFFSFWSPSRGPTSTILIVGLLEGAVERRRALGRVRGSRDAFASSGRRRQLILPELGEGRLRCLDGAGVVWGRRETWSVETLGLSPTLSARTEGFFGEALSNFTRRDVCKVLVA